MIVRRPNKRPANFPKTVFPTEMNLISSEVFSVKQNDFNLTIRAAGAFPLYAYVRLGLCVVWCAVVGHHQTIILVNCYLWSDRMILICYYLFSLTKCSSGQGVGKDSWLICSLPLYIHLFVINLIFWVRWLFHEGSALKTADDRQKAPFLNT